MTTTITTTPAKKKIRVLVIDDSALMRKLLVEFLSQDPQIEIAGTAPDPIVARDKIKALNPDVLTLDVEMPRMDGLTFLENLMRLRPMPVVMVSSLTERGAEVTLQALELGAVDFVTKPKIDLEAGVRQYAQDLIAKIKAAANAKVRGLGMTRAAAPAPRPSKLFRTTDRIIAIGASTGGTEAIKDVLAMMPADAPAILITQHIPAAFSAPFAARMDRSSAMSVCEARDGQLIIPGHVYIAPGDWHLSLARDGARYVCRLDQAPPENRHRPSVDVLFKSVARHAGANAVAAVLTGMGDDGARGLLAMREAGARTLVQDEASSVVWGMPGAAFKLGGAEQICELHQIAGQLLAHCDALAA
jgi:two-component system chemotaxis response regulator CheB